MDKYIQETKWFQEARKAGVKALGREYHKVIDEAIIKALGCKEPARPSEKAKPPKPARVSLSTTCP